MGEHETQSIYRFAEGFAKYDLSLQLAIKSKEIPEFQFMQGTEVMTAQCYNAPQVTDDGDNFIICPCYIMPLKTNQFCSLIVDSPARVNFAYKLLGWNYASTD